MIILISPEKNIKSEIKVVHQLFEAGLTHFHLRKPTFDINAYKKYINAIDPRYHHCIITHNFHKELCAEYAIKGIHLEEAQWRAQGDSLPTYVDHYVNNGFTVSSSYHEPEDLAKQSVAFNYTILSPVFAAISKSTMQGRGFDVRDIDKYIVGMGGINATTAPQAVALGFQGIGALGGVWNDPDPVAAFCDMKDAFEVALDGV